jgi:hypothetical protein
MRYDTIIFDKKRRSKMDKIHDMKLEHKKIRWGNHNTQDFRVATYLNTGAALSPMSAQINLDGVSRLAARIETINSVLQAAGYPIIKNTIKHTANRKRYSEYRGFVPADVLEVL